MTRDVIALGSAPVPRGLVVASWLVTLLFALSARADWLQVERRGGAESCPDAAQLEAQVRTIRAPGASQQEALATPYRVEFGREMETLVARVRRSDRADHVRTLTAQALDCRPLAQAVAVALALLRDAEPASAPPPVVPIATPPRAPESRTAAPLPAAPGEPRARVTLSLGAGALLGVVRTAAPALEGELGAWLARFRIALGVLGVPLHREPFGPGSLRSWQLAGSAKGCATPYNRSRWRVDVCGGIYAGVLDVRARGFTRNDQRKQPWLAIPLELSVHRLLGPVAVGVSAAALFGVKRPQFSIEGLGNAFDPWPVSALISARLVGALPSFAKRAKKQ